MRLLNLLNGKKTYLGMVALGILGFCWSAGWVDDQTAGMIGAVLTTLTGASYRQSNAKIEKKLDALQNGGGK